MGVIICPLLLVVAAAHAVGPPALGAVYLRPSAAPSELGADEFVRQYRRRFGQPFALPSDQGDGVAGCGNAPCWGMGKFRYCLPTTYVLGVRKCWTYSLHKVLWSVVWAGSKTTAYQSGDGVSLRTGQQAPKETHFLSTTLECISGGDCNRSAVGTQCSAIDAWTPPRRDPLVLWTSLYQTLAGPTCEARFSRYVESSPESIHAKPDMLAALARLLPRTARFIVTLRHPPSRAWSDYLFTRSVVCGKTSGPRGTVRSGLHIYAKHDPTFNCSLPAATLPGEFGTHVHRVRDVCSLDQLLFATGCYHKLIRRLPVNALVMRIEDWQTDPVAFGNRLTAFLGRDSGGSTTAPVPQVHATHGMPQGKDRKLSMPQATACLLEELYRRPLRKLSCLLRGAAFNWLEEHAKAVASDCT
ncbi:hypothetical protein T492DRAFT_1133101 [Pavlovales sp. CCMP2436]|nr:hypothetical protein T492DRAFT_1133101 [Pavlovales sp. CCMP2436]